MIEIVIAGGGRRVGKTTLAVALAELLPDAAAVKIGVHAEREGRPAHFFPSGTAHADIVRRVGEPRYLIVESGEILRDEDCRPELVIFLPALGGDKPGSDVHRARAHLVRGERPGPGVSAALREALDLDAATFERVLGLVTGEPDAGHPGSG